MLELPNFSQMSTLKYDLSHVIKFYWWRHEQKLWRRNLYFKLLSFLIKSGTANFADIIKIAILIIKMKN